MIEGRDSGRSLGEAYGSLQHLETVRGNETVSRFDYTRESTNVQVIDSLRASAKADIKQMTQQTLASLRNRVQAANTRVRYLRAQQGELPAQASEFSRLAQGASAVQETFDQLAT